MNIFLILIFLKPEMYIMYTFKVYIQCDTDSHFALKTIIKLMLFLKMNVILDSKTYYHSLYFPYKKH